MARIGIPAAILWLTLSLVRPQDALARTAPGAALKGPAQTKVRSVLPGATDKPEVASSAGESRTTTATPTGPSFQVDKIVFVGNTAISTNRLSRVAASYEHKKLTLQDLKALALKVNDIYRVEGYFLAQAVIPAQSMERNEIKVLVFEGPVGEVQIEGNKHYARRFIRRFFEPAIRSGLIRQGPLHRSLLLLNDFLDLEVQSIFQKGKKPGTADVVLKVKDTWPVHVSLTYNNFGRRLSGQNRAGVGLQTGNNLVWGDSLYLGIIDSFPSDGKPLNQLSYLMPVGRAGNLLAFQYSTSATTVGGDFEILDIRGDADVYELNLQHPIVRRIDESTTLTTGLSVKTMRNKIFGDILTSQDDLRMLTFGFSGWRFEKGGRFIHSSVLTQGLGTALGGQPNGHPFSSRVGAGNSFTMLSTTFIRTFQQGKSHILVTRFGGQVSTRPLVSAEMLGIGGSQSVRGYLQSEFLGDDGYTVSLEHLSVLDPAIGIRPQVAFFLDHGQAFVKRPQPGEKESLSLTGIGTGLRLGWGKSNSLSVDLGFPLAPRTTSEGDGSVLYVQFSQKF